MKYHSLKMEEVNDTMRHLWNKTYQGTGSYPFRLRDGILDPDIPVPDIDGICIRSDIFDVEEGGGRRSHKYRVSLSASAVHRFDRGLEGGYDEGSGRDGHARAVFSRPENVSFYYHSACPRGFVRPELWYSCAGRTHECSRRREYRRFSIKSYGVSPP